MIKVVIVEDEIMLSDHLIKLLEGYGTSKNFVTVQQIDNVVDAIDWFLNNECPDLIFMDVHLSDGVCFEIFKKVEISCPIIYTTAYDEHVIKAFKANGIDYLLKPITENNFYQTIFKFLEIRKVWG